MKNKMLERELNTSKRKQSYDRVSNLYGIWSRLTQTEAARKVIELAKITNHQNILEIPCGTGLVFEEILKRNPNGFSIGVDLSKGMLTKAKKRVEKYPQTQYELNEGDVTDMKYDDNFFDIIISNYVMSMLPEDQFDYVASEFHRLLKSDGTIVVSIFSYGTKK